MMDKELIKVLLVEDDEDDYVITRDLLAEIPRRQFAIDWIKTFELGLKELLLHRHDICLIDYRLGSHNGIELLRAAISQGCQLPFIVLTGNGEHTIDMEAMEAGAADYLVKSRLDANSLERSIRYSLQRQSAAAFAAFEQARLAAFGADIGFNLTRTDSLDGILDRSAKAMVRYLDASLAQIFVFDDARKTFECRAAATPAGTGKLGDLPPLPTQLDFQQLSKGRSALINLRDDGLRLQGQTLASRELAVSFAAHPLVLDNRMVGLMSVYAARRLSGRICEEMGSVANGLALCIQRKLSEEALGVSEDKFRSVVENIKEVIFELDAEGRWTFLNPSWKSITGRDIRTSIGAHFCEHAHPLDREHSRERFHELIAGKCAQYQLEKRYLHVDGSVRWVEFHAEAIRDAGGKISGASGRLTDLTDRKMAESQIEKLAAFPRVNPNPVLEFAADGTLTYCNDATHKLASSLGNKSIPEILPANAAMIARECLQHGANKLREEVVLDSRTIVWSFFPVPALRTVHCYGADVTDRLSLEAQLRHSQKLECVGQLAAGVAHDFNNLLTIIQGYSDMLAVKFTDAPQAAAALGQISGAARRAAALTRQLLMFSRKQVIKTDLLDLNVVLQSFSKMLPRLLGEDISLKTSWTRDLPQIKADAGMIEQVVMNLAVNARDAMPRGGKLTIATELVAVDEQHAARNSEARVGEFICVTTADTGCGMDAKTMQKIFEPFFTTKEVGKGTGLGLATVYGIVKQHHGWIEVASEPGRGTVFKVYIPCAAKSGSDKNEQSFSTNFVRGGDETILVVEDEPEVRRLASDILKEYRYQVVEASSGTEALRIWDQQEGKIDLLLTDIIMPDGINGWELAAKLIDRKPDLPVIYTSGYNPEVIGMESGESEESFMAKPYTPPQLASMVRSRLDQRSAAR